LTELDKRREPRAILGSVHLQGDSDLAQIALALGGIRLLLSPRERRQKKRSQNRNDRDNHQQLDESETAGAGGGFEVQGTAGLWKVY
jgi:hypothetical protein